MHMFDRIHCCDSPVGYADGQQHKGDDRVEQGGRNIANCPWQKRQKETIKKEVIKQGSWRIGLCKKNKTYENFFYMERWMVRLF